MNPSTSDPFIRLGLSRDYDIDPDALEAAYVREQSRLHPDRFVGRPQEERTQALLESVAVNDAYAIVKDPLKRAAWLLRDAGFPVDAETGGVAAEPALLKEVMEMREMLEELSEPQELEAFLAMLERNIAATEQSLSEQFGVDNFPMAAQSAMRLKYLTTCLHDASRRLKTKVTAAS
ncbi:MAG: Fe-S protein assembly co-chaperone HscB [Alphaproteobacteria bacterium]|nr:Fe-S protein assembly co-chaperone HscB [Alphaproteobacteria bacterium]